MATLVNNYQKIAELSNRDRELALRKALTDPLSNAFIISNLTQLRADCSIFAKFKGEEPVAVASFYMDLPFYNIALMSDSALDAKQVIDELAKKHPQLQSVPVFGLYNNTITKYLEKSYKVITKTPELKMVLSVEDIPECQIDSSRYRLERLTLDDLVQICHLYGLVPAMAWTPKVLTYGPYFGIYCDDTLVSIGGVHFTSKWVAEIGNVVTHFKHLRQNLAYSCTKAVADNIRNACQYIFLCVFADNAPAIRLYEKMGFVKYEDLYLVKYYIS
jgi:GNAT superfamily N-acetyltransferase